MSKLDGVFSHKSDDWATPTDIYNHFINDLKCVDPCPLHSLEDNLDKTYENKLIYINPPYSKIDSWCDFIENNLISGCVIYLLIPSRTDTKYFHRLMKLRGCAITLNFIKGRLKFGGSKQSAPFPSVLIKLRYLRISIISCNFINRNDLLSYE